MLLFTSWIVLQSQLSSSTDYVVLSLSCIPLGCRHMFFILPFVLTISAIDRSVWETMLSGPAWCSTFSGLVSNTLYHLLFRLCFTSIIKWTFQIIFVSVGFRGRALCFPGVQSIRFVQTILHVFVTKGVFYLNATFCNHIFSS